MKNTIAIDYSMTSPAICINGTELHFVSGNKKYANYSTIHKGFTITGHLMPDYTSDADRFNKLADVLLLACPPNSDYYLEDYAMGARGRVFAIGENAGVLKNKIHLMGEFLDTVNIPQIKKHATGKGNAKKDVMADAFNDRHGFYMHDIVGGTVHGSPASDLVDAWWIWDLVDSR